jgi:hypothetical protein
VNIVIPRPLWEGDQGVLKRSGRDEPMWVIIQLCMEATLQISLYSCVYLKLAKMLSLLLSLMFSLEQNQRTRGWNRFCPEVGGGRKGVRGGGLNNVHTCE